MVTNLGDVNVEDDDIFGHGYRLSAPDQVAPALERATREVTEEGRQDVADVVCA